ncbi:MAG: hypothetical protein Q7T25_13130 [Sideroxyarcus sp.]|nr:hypothetical protein [Sideroxyarcus sp.]
MSYTAEELALLSDEERAAIADDQPNVDALKAIAGDDDVGDEVVGDPVVAEAVAAETPVQVEQDKEIDTFTHHYQAAPVEDYDTKVAELAAQKVELRRQMNEGDIDLDAYESQKDAIVAQEMILREQKIKADISAEQNEQSSKARWLWDQERFFEADANAIYKDKYLLAAFDAAVRDLGGDEANASKKGSWFLQEADKLVRARFNAPTQAAPAVKQTDGRKPDLSVVPKTLAHLPAADIPQTGEVGEFDHLDRLNGLELEKAVSRLSEAERERYRAAA